MTIDLPAFKYHPDPIGTGSVEPTDEVCEVCGLARGFKYASVIFSDSEIEVVCPWCIADGSAYERFGAEFTDAASIGAGYDVTWDTVPVEIVDEVAYRTPGFASWQNGGWFTHCGDAAAFIGPAGKRELKAYGPDVIEAIRRESGLEGDEWAYYFDGLDRNYNATAFLFRCRHCGLISGYSDCI